MNRIRLPLVALLTVLALAAVGEVAAAKTDPNLWATVNVCDTQKHPNFIGIRGRISGNGDKHTNLYMKFIAQFKNSSGKWVKVPKAATGFIKEAKGNVTWASDGHNFKITQTNGDPLLPGQKFTLRGIVKYEWRKNGNVIKSAKRHTVGGHPHTMGADPKSYSAATCVVKGP